MNPLSACEPSAVFTVFGELCAIPHGSGNLEKISDYCISFAETQSLSYARDILGNVIIRKKGTPGYEQSPTIILQGHLDMVCAAEPGKQVDFLHEGIRPYVDGDWIRADGTSLGGDDGIAVAMILAILADPSLPHPPLEAVFTVNEETGMDGAVGLDPNLLTGRRMINLDSEDEGVFTVGCAGGVRADCTIPVKRVETDAVRCEIDVDGLYGGHSGTEIDKERGNANQILGRLLHDFCNTENVRLVSLQGGTVDNAIPCRANAVLAVDSASLARLESLTVALDKKLKAEYAISDPNVSLHFSARQVESLSAANSEITRRIAGFLFSAPCGIQHRNPEMPTLVETSLNPGVARMDGNGDHFVLTFSLRSSVSSRKEELADQLTCLAAAFGAETSFHSSYPAWEYRHQSPLREIVLDTYRRLYRKEPVVETIHAGLECGIFSEKLPGLDCVSFGPDIPDIHSPAERLSISSVSRTYRLVTEILKNCR